jgi:endogenous inhibitor of DNA gyrase (YacG/DUF329 family)
MVERNRRAGRARNGPGPKCPICGKPRDPDYRPFCSRRCADVDLGRWLSEGYAIPLPESEIDSEPDDPER